MTITILFLMVQYNKMGCAMIRKRSALTKELNSSIIKFTIIEFKFKKEKKIEIKANKLSIIVEVSQNEEDSL